MIKNASTTGWLKIFYEITTMMSNSLFLRSFEQNNNVQCFHHYMLAAIKAGCRAGLVMDCRNAFIDHATHPFTHTHTHTACALRRGQTPLSLIHYSYLHWSYRQSPAIYRNTSISQKDNLTQDVWIIGLTQPHHINAGQVK